LLEVKDLELELKRKTFPPARKKAKKNDMTVWARF